MNQTCNSKSLSYAFAPHLILPNHTKTDKNNTIKNRYSNPIKHFKMNKLIKILSTATILIYTNYCFAQSCDSKISDKRLTQVVNMTQPYSYIAHMTMKRVCSYTGTAFLIHPRVLLTAGHNLRKRNFGFRVKRLTLKFGATNNTTNLYSTNFETNQLDNIYTLQSFNDEYSINSDYGIVILPDSQAYKKAMGCFKLTVFDWIENKKHFIQIGEYPGNKDYCTQWRDSTNNFFYNDGHIHYEFSTEHGASGSPIWYNYKNDNLVFAIHTNDDSNKFKCNTGTLITQEIYDDIVRFCKSKGIDITK